MKTEDKFWIIWEPTYSEPPKVRFWKEESAVEVAEGMTLKSPDKDFYVLECRVRVRRKRGVEKVKLTGVRKEVKKTKFEEAVEKGVREEIGRRMHAARGSRPPGAGNDTYEGWKSRGRQVKFGEKSRQMGIKTVFHWSQTKAIGGEET